MRVICFVLVLGAVACGSVGERPPDGRCATAVECTDPAAPFCVDSECSASCSVAADCVEADRGVCAADGACVGCEVASDCGSEAPICDDSARACRGCAADAECGGGVCIEAEGACVADADVAFVADLGSDTGACTRATPCATLTFAITQAGTARRVIHVLGGTLNTGSVTLGGDYVLDGEDTTIGSAGATTLTIRAPANITVEGFRLVAPTAGTTPAISVSGFGAVGILHDLQITGTGLAVTVTNSAEVTLARSHIGSLATTSTVQCTNAKLRVDQCVLEQTIVNDGNTQCEATVTRNRFESSRDGSVQLTGGQLVMENNLVIHRDGFNDSILAVNLRPGSTIRFNTIVNTTALPSDGAALSCDNAIEVTSNIFAYNSGHPITGLGCATRFSVFDDQSTTAAGTGNQLTGIDQIFVNRGTGDYHLSASSVARAGAEPGQNMVKIDFDGQPRPSPSDTTADSGAFEAP